MLEEVSTVNDVPFCADARQWMVQSQSHKVPRKQRKITVNFTFNFYSTRIKNYSIHVFRRVWAGPGKSCRASSEPGTQKIMRLRNISVKWAGKHSNLIKRTQLKAVYYSHAYMVFPIQTAPMVKKMSTFYSVSALNKTKIDKLHVNFKLSAFVILSY
jgi:hypothetical protein